MLKNDKESELNEKRRRNKYIPTNIIGMLIGLKWLKIGSNDKLSW
jgi:hypothetical protein